MTWRALGDLPVDPLGIALRAYSDGRKRAFKVVKGDLELPKNSPIPLSEKGTLEPLGDDHFRRILASDLSLDDGGQATVLLTLAKTEFVDLFADSVGEHSSHSEVARAMISTHHFVTLTHSKEILIYRGGVYERNAEAIVDSIAERIKGSKSYNGFVSEVRGHISRSNLKKVDEFDSDPTRVHLKDGILNLRTYKVEPETPGYLSFAKVNMRYDRKARCPTIISFIEEVHDNSVDKLHDIDFIAACLYNKSIKKSKLDWGDTDSGKTTYQHLVEAALGPENVCHISPQDLENDRFIAYNIVGKLAQLHGDVDKKSLDKSTKFKTTTGGDTIPVQRKHGQPFDYSPRAKPIFAANQIPETKDESDAFFNRWVPEHWPFIFKEDGKYAKDAAGKLVKVNDTKKDPYIIDRMTTEAELSGLLNICLRRLPLIVESKSIPYAPSIDEVRQIWLVNSDFTRLFLHETVKKEVDGELDRQPFYLAYHSWCGQKGITPDTQRTFNNRVEWIMGAKKLDTTREGKDVQLWKGLTYRRILGKPPVVPVSTVDQSILSGATGETGATSNLLLEAEEEWEEIKAAFGDSGRGTEEAS
jgi:phage/plasmid-associated DNA primase